MVRRNHRPIERLEAILSRLQSGLADTPLEFVGEHLRTFGIGIICAIQTGAGRPDQAIAAANYLERTITALPNSFGKRFFFDAAMIQALCEQWSSKVGLSSVIIPRHGFSWGHSQHQMPSENGERAHYVDLIHIPGEDNQGEIDLLEYPFMCHELGHCIFQKDESQFSEVFENSLNQIITRLRLRTLSDRGAAKDRAQRRIQEIYKFWHPTSSHKNWAHELAMDIVALWTCGPAYLDAFGDEIDECDPYQIDQEHPPYEVRTLALAEAGRRLGWESQISNLLVQIDDWHSPRSKYRRTNRYIALTDAHLIEASIRCAVSTCEALLLPRCTSKIVENVEAILSRGETPDFGLETILSARIVQRNRNEGAYQEWEKETISELIKLITP